VEPWLQAGKYAAALMSDLPRRNGWTLAERAGDRTPDRMQRLLSRAVWDAAAAIRVVHRFAVAGLDQAARRGGRRGLAVGAIDETSQVKQGDRTAGNLRLDRTRPKAAKTGFRLPMRWQRSDETCHLGAWCEHDASLWRCWDLFRMMPLIVPMVSSWRM
jgi:hypothetical protein